MTIEEILEGLEGLKDLTNEQGKKQIEVLKGIVRQWGAPASPTMTLEDYRAGIAAQVLGLEDEPEEEPKPVVKATKPKKARKK